MTINWLLILTDLKFWHAFEKNVDMNFHLHASLIVDPANCKIFFPIKYCILPSLYIHTCNVEMMFAKQSFSAQNFKVQNLLLHMLLILALIL